MNDINRILNLQTNDTYITNVEDFEENLNHNIEIDSNTIEYLRNLIDFLKNSSFSNKQTVINIINNALNNDITYKGGIEYEGRSK